MDDCVFCKIGKKEIPSSTVYEDDKVIAFIPTGYINKGHVLIVPKNHSETILDISDDDLCACAIAIKKISNAIKDYTKCDGVNLHQNNFPAAGQEVAHTHFHLIPRFLDDGFRNWPLKTDYDDGEMQEIAVSLKEHL